LLGDEWGSDDHFHFLLHDSNGAQVATTVNNFFNTYMNQWVLVRGVFIPGESVSLYINNELASQTTNNVPMSVGTSTGFRIGARTGNSTWAPWNGLIDEVIVIPAAVTPDSIWHFDEGDGSIAADSSMLANDGTLKNGVQWVSGHDGSALDFDGTNDYVEFSDTIDTTGAFSVEAWVKPEAAPSERGRVVAGTYAYNGGGSNARGWLLGDEWGSDDHFHFLLHDSNGAQVATTVNNFFSTYMNQWVLVKGVFIPGESISLYINNVLTSQTTNNVPMSVGTSTGFRIGARTGNSTWAPWNGLIDEVRVSPAVTELSAPTVERVTYTLDGKTVAVRVSGHPDGDANGLFYLHTDHLGSVTAMTDENGELVDDSVSRFYPFGAYRNEAPATNPDVSDRGFTGHKMNNTGGNDLGLVYMNARFYASELRRFISADTIVPDPGNPQAFNRYSYGYNNPVKYFDPSGHDVECWTDDNGADVSCINWVNQAIAILQADGGAEGIRLAKFFWSWANDPEKLLLIHAYEASSGSMFTRHFNKDMAGIWMGREVVKTLKKSQIALFGHELEHVSQGQSQAWSIQGEILAYQVEYRIRDAMFGVGQTINTRAAQSGDKRGYPYDANNYQDLLNARHGGFLDYDPYNQLLEPTLPWDQQLSHYTSQAGQYIAGRISQSAKQIEKEINALATNVIDWISQ
jgi:RHS repeat-associated protein